MPSQGSHMVGDEVLGALDDPGEVTDAELLCLEQRRGNCQPRRIGKRVCLARGGLRFMHLESPNSQPLRGRQVEAEKIAAIIGHDIILTLIGALLHATCPELQLARLVARKRGLHDAPGRIRTCDRRLRRPLLCPLSYGRHGAL